MRSLTILALALAHPSGDYSRKRLIADDFHCPDGFTLNGKECYKNIYAPLELRCRDSRAVLSGGLCLLDSEPRYSCPSGSVSRSGGCVTQQITDPEYECASGTLQNQSCVSEQTRTLDTYCASGTREGDECVNYETAPLNHNYSCPAGFEESDKGCFFFEMVQCTPEAIAAAGMPMKSRTSMGGKGIASRASVEELCERKSYADKVDSPSCPSGFSLENASCRRRITEPVKTRCPAGTVDQGGVCTSTSRSSPRQVCRQGTLQGSRCIEDIPVDQIRTCPSGTTDQGSTCVTSTQPEEYCSSGYIREGQQCMKRETAEPTGTITHTCIGKGCQQSLSSRTAIIPGVRRVPPVGAVNYAPTVRNTTAPSGKFGGY